MAGVTAQKFFALLHEQLISQAISFIRNRLYLQKGRNDNRKIDNRCGKQNKQNLQGMVTVVKFCFIIYHWGGKKGEKHKFLKLKNKISGNGVFLFFITVEKISLMLEFQFSTTSCLWNVNVSNKM